MDSNRNSSGPEVTAGWAEGTSARARSAKSPTEQPWRAAKIWCAIATTASLGPEGDPTKSLEVSSRRLSVSGISLQTRERAREKSNRIENALIGQLISVTASSQQLGLKSRRPISAF